MGGPRVRGVERLVLAMGLCGLAFGAGAATFTVTTTEDAGVGSLRQAIIDANDSLDPLGDTIVFMLPVDSEGIILLVTDLPDLVGPVSVDATGLVIPNVSGEGLQLLQVDGEDAGVVDLGLGEGEISIGEGDTLTLTANNDFTVSSNVSDLDAAPGAIVKNGLATLELVGVNSFTGTLTLEEGTLVGNTLSLPDDITTDGALVFDQLAVDDIYDGVIDGTGSLEKRGTGELTLTGDHTFTGGTTISEGELITIDENTLPGDVQMAANARLVFRQDTADGELAGNITGAGSVRKAGPNDLLLTGDNSYSGGTIVSEGALIGDSGAIQGNVELSAVTSILIFDEPATGTHAGAISGDGNLVKRGAGTVSLTGSNSYTGGTSIEAGTLVVNTNSLPGDVAPPTVVMMDAAVIFDQSFDGTFTGVINGAGSFEKRGIGTLTLTDAQGFGPASVSGGTLELGDSASLAGSLDVSAGGTLSGTGEVMGATDLFGRVTPAASGQGALDVADITFRDGSTLVVNVDDGVGQDDQILAGAVTIEGSPFLEVLPAPGSYAMPGVTKDLVVGSSVTGAFDLGEPFAFLDVAFDPAPANIVRIRLSANMQSVATVGTTPNQQAVGAALGTLTGSADPNLVQLFTNLNTLRASQAGSALDALSPEPTSAFTTARVAMGERLQRTLHRRMRSVLFAPEESWPDWIQTTRTSPGPTDVAALPRPGERGVGTWLDGYGVLGDLDGDGNASQLDYRLYGTTAGVDFRLGDHWLAGAVAGYARTDLELEDRQADGAANSAQGAVYAAYASHLFYAGASGRYAWSRGDSTRDIDIGTLSARARSDFDSQDFGIRGELAVNAFEKWDTRLQPLAAFDWSRLDRESFQERGAGLLGLAVDSEQLDTALLQLGTRIETLFVVGEEEATAVLAPELRVFWLHEFGDTERQVEAAIAGAPFSVQGAEAPRDAVLAGVGWGLTLGRNVRASADYDVRIDADRLEHTGNISVRLRF